MLTLLDQFCGAGGSSSGAELVPGVSLRLALNHWRLATEVHAQNFPHADHDACDISQANPRRYPRTDLCWSSPECTWVSQAHGRKLTADSQPDLFGEVLPSEAALRSRATMWDVLRFAEYHKYKGGVVENVVQERNWVLWPSWTTGLQNLGYDYRVVYMNSMFAQSGGLPAPQSRDRLYVVFWRQGDRKPNFDKWIRPVAMCSKCGKTDRAVQAWKRADRPWGKYREQYVWRCGSCATEVFPPVLPAASAIDWELPGQRIGDRTKPLSKRTMARIAAGLKRYARPIHLEAAGNTYEHGSYFRAWPIDEPFRTMHTSASKAVACPPMLVPSGGTWNEDARTVYEPMRTRTTRENEAIVRSLPAMLMRNNSTDNDNQSWPCTPVDNPMRTLTTGGHQSLIRWSDAEWPTQAMIVRAYTARGDPGQMNTPVYRPLPTQTASGSQFLARWDHMIYAYDTGELRPVGEPLPTQTTIVGDGLLAPSLEPEDCDYRMLEPHEVKWGMAFPRDYKMRGTRREQIHLSGQAVTPPAARDLIACVTEAITGEEIDFGKAA